MEVGKWDVNGCCGCGCCSRREEERRSMVGGRKTLFERAVSHDVLNDSCYSIRITKVQGGTYVSTQTWKLPIHLVQPHTWMGIRSCMGLFLSSYPWTVLPNCGVPEHRKCQFLYGHRDLATIHMGPAYSWIDNPFIDSSI